MMFTTLFTTLRIRCLLALMVGALLSHSPAFAEGEKAPKAAKPAPVQVMILGSYHMGNPGLDQVNVEVDDVTLPKRQRELVALTEQLTKFAPTKVAVEMVPKTDTFAVRDYETFSPSDLLKDRNEITQIGFRLAHRMKHRAVFAIDEQSKTVDYFPFDKVEAYAKANGQEPELAALKAKWAAEGEHQASMQPRLTVSKILAELNDPAAISRNQSHYTLALGLGQGNDWAGAELNAAWYLRNAKIYAKLMKIARPGDRILVLYGAGHNYLLRDFVRTTPGFILVEPQIFLR